MTTPACWPTRAATPNWPPKRPLVRNQHHRYPEQVTALILGSAAARWFPAADYPCGEAAVEMYESLRDIAAHHWGRGDSIEWYLPSRAADPHARELFARFERLAVTPGALLDSSTI